MRKEKIKILGVGVNNTNKAEVLKEIKNFIKSSEQHYLVTPNPEILLLAQKDEVLFNALEKADIALADGMGLKIASWFSFVNLKRLTGADICPEILRLAEQEKLKVAVLNWNGGLSSSEDIKIAIKKIIPNLNFICVDAPREWILSDYEELNIFEPQILFVTFGAPYQEKFISKNINKMPYLRLALGIGGSFDFLSGKTKRAPQIFRFFGLEWLWRAFSQGKGERAFQKSKRLKRVFRAIFIFPFYFIRYKFIRPFLYRPNVACLMYKKENNKFKFFIIERIDENNHWQIPQGGLDGQKIITAGIRELTEECGTNKFRPVKSFKNISKYKFNFSNNSEKNYRFGYKGQIQSLFLAEFTGNDGDISIQAHNHSGWRWVDKEEFIQSTHPLRKETYKKFLEIFNKLNYTNETKN